MSSKAVKLCHKCRKGGELLREDHTPRGQGVNRPREATVMAIGNQDAILHTKTPVRCGRKPAKAWN